MNKSKDEQQEEIVRGFVRKNSSLPDVEKAKLAVFLAMDELAKITAIFFAEFISSNGWQQYDGHDTWICPPSRGVLSTNELFNLFIQNQNNKP